MGLSGVIWREWVFGLLVNRGGHNSDAVIEGDNTAVDMAIVSLYLAGVSSILGAIKL